MLGQFKWVYAFLSPVGGYVADRFSRRLTICGSLFVWSAVTWWTGHVTTYDELLWARALMGISEAFYIPAALALIADYHTGAHALARRRAAPDGHLLRRDRRRLRRLRRRRARRSAGGWPSTPAACSGCSTRCRWFLLLSESAARRRWTPLHAAPVTARARCASCWPIARSSCWCSTSRCRRWPAGSCATGCRRSSRSSSTSARARPACRRRSTGRPRRSSARWSAAGWPTAGCGNTRAAASTSAPSA